MSLRIAVLDSMLVLHIVFLLVRGSQTLTENNQATCLVNKQIKSYTSLHKFILADGGGQHLLK